MSKKAYAALLYARNDLGEFEVADVSVFMSVPDAFRYSRKDLLRALGDEMFEGDLDLSDFEITHVESLIANQMSLINKTKPFRDNTVAYIDIVPCTTNF